MTDEGKAVEQTAKTVGKAIDAVREAGGFIAKYVSGPLEQGMAIFEDRLKYLRWERQVRLMKRADEFLRQQGLTSPTRTVPLKIAIPLLQEGGIEEDDDLQDMWAQLLANAADGNSGIEIQRSYIDILSQISPLEAKILDAIYSIPFTESQHIGIVTENLPDFVRLKSKDINENKNIKEPSDEVMLALGNLSRLGCIRPARTFGGGESFSIVNPTFLGLAFVAACKQKNV